MLRMLQLLLLQLPLLLLLRLLLRPLLKMTMMMMMMFWLGWPSAALGIAWVAVCPACAWQHIPPQLPCSCKYTVCTDGCTQLCGTPHGHPCSRPACLLPPPILAFLLCCRFASLLLVVACWLWTPRAHVQPGGQRCAFAAQGYHVGPGMGAVLCLLRWCAMLCDVSYAVLCFGTLCCAMLC